MAKSRKNSQKSAPKQSDKRSTARPASVSDTIRRELAAAALEKRKRGHKPSSAELAALKAIEREREERDRWDHYGSIPKKHWREMSGCQDKVLNGHAERYGVPVGVGKREIDLSAVVSWLHRFLSDNGRKLMADDPDLSDPMLAGGEVASSALEEYRREKAKIARLERLQMERVLVRRDQIQPGLSRLAQCLRKAGEDFQRLFGPDALDRFNEMIEVYGNELARIFGDDPENEQDDEPEDDQDIRHA